jgi:hypothetical protein
MAMSNDEPWDDESREDLRQTLRWGILGRVRLANRDREDLLETCRQIYLEDTCPEDEQEAFVRFAGEVLDRVQILHASEMASWPEQTDCDRLDRVEAALRERGILLWQVSPCCNTCTTAEIPDRIDLIERRHPGFRDRVRGYAYFVDQNMPEMLAEDTQISVYLGYGWFSPEDAVVPPGEYEPNALGIAREVCQCLRDEGFEVDWNGDLANKIGLSLNWQRRTVLE